MFTYAFEAGSSHRYRVKVNQEMDFGGNTMGQIADFEVTVKCASVADGKAAMELTFDKADMSRSMFGNLAADPMAETIVGKSVNYTVDAAGEVTDIKPATYYDGWDQVRQMVESFIESWYVPLPGKAYAPGATWEHSEKDKGAGGMDVAATGTYKFKERKQEGGRDCASVTGEIATELSGQSVNPMGTFTVEGGGKGKSEFLFDPAARLVIKLKSKTDVSMNLTPAAGGDPMEANVVYQIERELL
jgi:hypothetical protein